MDDSSNEAPQYSTFPRDGELPYNPETIELAINILSPKWTVNILQAMATGPQRPKELEKTLGGISPKILAERLTDLQKAQIILRTEFKETPRRVEYSLSEIGQQWFPVFKELTAFGQLCKEAGVNTTFARTTGAQPKRRQITKRK